jgi:hypothetical protein
MNVYAGLCDTRPHAGDLAKYLQNFASSHGQNLNTCAGGETDSNSVHHNRSGTANRGGSKEASQFNIHFNTSVVHISRPWEGVNAEEEWGTLGSTGGFVIRAQRASTSSASSASIAHSKEEETLTYTCSVLIIATGANKIRHSRE